MSHYNAALRLEEVFGPPETHEPGPADENLRGVALPSRQPVTPTRTYEARRELKIQEGDCPLPGCYARLDDDYYCSGCGNVSLPAAIESDPTVSSGEPVGQPELPYDEFGPAQVEAA